MKVECPQLKRKIHFGDKKKKILMVIWDDPNNENNNTNTHKVNKIWTSLKCTYLMLLMFPKYFRFRMR